MTLENKKSENLSAWYIEVIQRAQLADYSPVQGCIVFRETAYAIWERIREILDRMLKETGHRNVYFPLFIPESLLRKEAEHFEGFVPECAWVTIGGDSELGERLAIRPTSETIIYSMYSKWIRGWRDLPVKLNQWCNVVRWETKMTKPFLRTREFLWQEGHTCHATLEEAEEEIKLILQIYRRLIEEHLAIPVLVGIKSESEKFAGAFYTATLEAMMPDGKALQAGTVHNLGQNFSKPFEIIFQDRDGENKYVWQTSWGVSTRLIGAMIMVHGDDKGLIIPPKVAPIQVVCIPIFYKEEETETILEEVERVRETLLESGVRAEVDIRREYTPGWKFNEWELRGVPLRVEIGPRDVREGKVTLARRDTGERISVEEEEIVEKVEEMLNEIQKNLFERAKKFLEDMTEEASSYDNMIEILRKRGGFVRAEWCGSPECEKRVKEESGATIRLIPPGEKGVGRKTCIVCGRKSKYIVYFARAY